MLKDVKNYAIDSLAEYQNFQRRKLSYASVN